MERADKDLAFMLQYENVAWYDRGAVRILDRRVYPRQVSFVTCRSHEEVAAAISMAVAQATAGDQESGIITIKPYDSPWAVHRF